MTWGALAEAVMVETVSETKTPFQASLRVMLENDSAQIPQSIYQVCIPVL